MPYIGVTAGNMHMSEPFRPSLVDFSSMMRRVRADSTIAPLEAIPLPKGWSFCEGDHQLQVVVGKKEMPRYKLLYDLKCKLILCVEVCYSHRSFFRFFHKLCRFFGLWFHRFHGRFH